VGADERDAPTRAKCRFQRPIAVCNGINPPPYREVRRCRTFYRCLSDSPVTPTVERVGQLH